MRRAICLFFTLIMLSSISWATGVSELVFSIDGSGRVSVEARIKQVTNQVGSTEVVKLYVLGLPFSINEGASEPRHPEDVRISTIGKGDGFTLLAIAVPASRDLTVIRWDGAYKLSESPEGKAKINMDLTFPFLSQIDKQLISASYALPIEQVTIELPREFDATELSYRPLQAQWINKRTYIVSQLTTSTQQQKDIWVVFPNPMKSQLQYAKVVLAFLVGIFTLVIHIPALKQRQVSWSLAVLGLSVIVSALFFYYSYSLSKRLDFIEWAAGFVPHVIYGFVTSIFLLLARRRQATITGLVTADGAPREYADIVLFRIIDGEPKEEKRLDALSKEGRYVFHVWLKASTASFVVTASARGTTEGSSDTFEVGQGRKIELPAVDLNWRTADTADATQEQRQEHIET